jgi:hypothetical protein
MGGVSPIQDFASFPELLIAQVSPANAIGRLQFFDGTTPLSTPMTVFGGFAWSIIPLSTGTRSLTAAYMFTNLGIGGCAVGGGFSGTPPPNTVIVNS